jgi:hypothetical protein
MRSRIPSTAAAERRLATNRIEKGHENHNPLFTPALLWVLSLGRRSATAPPCQRWRIWAVLRPNLSPSGESRLNQVEAAMTLEQKSLWQTIKPDVAKSMIGAIFITLLSTGFAWFTWYRDKQVNRIEQNIRRIEETQSEALLATHERWYRAWRLWHELEQLGKPRLGSENPVKSAAQAYDTAAVNWNIKERDIVVKLQSYIDQTGLAPIDLEFVSRIDCKRSFTPFYSDSTGNKIAELESSSITTFHIAMSHCFERFDDEIEKAKQYMTESGGVSDKKNFTASLSSAYEILDRIFYNEEAYRLKLYEQAFAAKRLEAEQLFYTYLHPTQKVIGLKKEKP